MKHAGKFGEHERCVRVAQSIAESNSSFLSALNFPSASYLDYPTADAWTNCFIALGSLNELSYLYPTLPRTCKPFASHEWPRQNFSLQYQYNVNQTGEENKEKYRFEDFLVDPESNLRTSMMRILWQTVKSITNEILSFRGTYFFKPSPVILMTKRKTKVTNI